MLRAGNEAFQSITNQSQSKIDNEFKQKGFSLIHCYENLAILAKMVLSSECFALIASGWPPSDCLTFLNGLTFSIWKNHIKMYGSYPFRKTIFGNRYVEMEVGCVKLKIGILGFSSFT